MHAHFLNYEILVHPKNAVAEKTKLKNYDQNVAAFIIKHARKFCMYFENISYVIHKYAQFGHAIIRTSRLFDYRLVFYYLVLAILAVFISFLDFQR